MFLIISISFLIAAILGTCLPKSLEEPYTGHEVFKEEEEEEEEEFVENRK